MHCKNCMRDFEGTSTCPNCGLVPDVLARSAGSPTLIKGLVTPPSSDAPRASRPSLGAISLLPVLWLAAILVAVPWILSGNGPSTPPRSPDVGAASLAANTPAGDAASTAAGDEDDSISLTIHLPANQWVDTGIDMCGCAHVKIAATGDWMTPYGETVDAAGNVLVDGDTPSHNDALTHRAPYGAMVGKVGEDPYALVGRFSDVNGDQFNDSGTLKLGMNAGRIHSLKNARGGMTITITGSGSLDHQPRFCDAPGQ